MKQLIILTVCLVAGCTSIDHREYGPFVRELDGLSELAISTYPADFPDRLSEKGATFEKVASAESVFFQVHIRDAKKKSGPNRHVQSIDIHSFTYRMGDEEPTQLLADYPGNFWMQGNPRYENRALEPVSFIPGNAITIEIHFTLNGKEFAFVGEMPSKAKSSTWPTVLVNQGV